MKGLPAGYLHPNSPSAEVKVLAYRQKVYEGLNTAGRHRHMNSVWKKLNLTDEAVKELMEFMDDKKFHTASHGTPSSLKASKKKSKKGKKSKKKKKSKRVQTRRRRAAAPGDDAVAEERQQREADQRLVDKIKKEIRTSLPKKSTEITETDLKTLVNVAFETFKHEVYEMYGESGLTNEMKKQVRDEVMFEIRSVKLRRRRDTAKSVQSLAISKGRDKKGPSLADLSDDLLEMVGSKLQDINVPSRFYDRMDKEKVKGQK